ncbi:MAG: aminomethyl transferase family protein [Acidobacteriia bacterium]|nr:aminomethyl transferase family protein [Terriglobia bacterium]
MSEQSLAAILQKTSPVKLLRNSSIGPYVYPVVQSEYTSWRDEQWAWQHACVLFNQSYHMSDMYVEGPDALKLLSALGINTFKNFGPNKAKQYVVCSPEGYVIGDVILFGLEENVFNLVGRPSVHNWVQYNCETGGYNAKCRRDERAAAQKGPIVRQAYRYQVQGPNALKLMEKVLGGPVPEVKFFQMTTFTIAGKTVRVLRHGMVGQPGFELFGPWGDGEAVKSVIVEAGKEFGLRLVGGRAYSSNTLESGWIPSPLPAIYTSPKMKAYREWLPATAYEGVCSLGGSFYSDNIEDYYLTPYDLGYGASVKFDHEFVGREALEKISKSPKRTKVTLALNEDDVLKAMRTMFQKGDRAKYIDFPSAVYATWPYDQVMKNGKTIGISTWVGYSSNEGKMLTLAILDNEHAANGNDVTFVWGEQPGTGSKPTVEPHVQMEIRAQVAPVPYAEVARTAYRPK